MPQWIQRLWAAYRHISALKGLLQSLGWLEIGVTAATSATTFLLANWMLFPPLIQFLFLLSCLVIIPLAYIAVQASWRKIIPTARRQEGVLLDHYGRKHAYTGHDEKDKRISYWVTAVVVAIAAFVFVIARFPNHDGPPSAIDAFYKRKLHLLVRPQDVTLFVGVQVIPPVWDWDRVQPVTGYLNKCR